MEHPWIKPYIDLCTQMRQQATSSFEKDFWKLMVNSFFGESIENKRKYVNVRAVLNQEQLNKCIKNPLYEEFMILDDSKAFVKYRKTRVIMDKPIYLGFTVLELSKLLMYNLHYSVFKPFYGSRLKLVYTDTDSFIYHMETENLYKDFDKLSDIMDFCDYPKDHPLYSEKNKKVIGKLKDEMHGEPISMVVALKSKLYYLETKNASKQQKRAKGVQRSILRDEITRETYLDCLFDLRVHKHPMRRITSKNHEIIGMEQLKISLSPLDDKRYALDKINTLAFGHFRSLVFNNSPQDEQQ